ncbi:hypothetical protein BDZ45DRAFT_220360 [Acephala macrosclerotiorum]|nr:hypothetical protein BDZ45DRAFT_220360 [Acephala macrosclerotiorum]
MKFGIQEKGYMRIITIVWAPNKGTPRLQEMEKFIQDHSGFQIGEAQAEALVRIPIKWLVLLGN